MKKILIIPLVAFSLIASPVYGATADATVEAKAGIKQGNPFYFLDLLSESLGGIFTWDKVAKARRHLSIAEERLAEAKELSSENKIESANRAIAKYEARLELALSEAESADEDDAKDEEKKEAVLKTIAEATIKHQTVLREVLAKAPESAKEGIQNAIEKSQNGRETALEAVLGIKATTTPDQRGNSTSTPPRNDNATTTKDKGNATSTSKNESKNINANIKANVEASVGL